MLSKLIEVNRSYRRFYEDYRIEMKTLEELVDLARLSASGANLQPLKYVLINNKKTNNKIFDCLKWAGAIRDWDGPEDGEKPSSYIVVLGDKSISRNFLVDQGIASQSILLGACEKGLGGCMLGAIDKTQIAKILNISDGFDVLLVIALGKPKEEIVIEEIADGEGIKYYRDEDNIHYVPKRKLSDVIIKQIYNDMEEIK